MSEKEDPSNHRSSGSIRKFFKGLLSRSKSLYEPVPKKFVKGIEGDISRFGIPERSSDATALVNYTICHNYEKHTPNWLRELLDSTKVTTTEIPQKFIECPTQNELFVVKVKDFLGSDWTMLPLSTISNTESIVDERQIISNVVFLHPSKLPTWEKVTAYVQNVLKYFSNACVVSGPLFLPTKNKKLSHVTYEVYGERDVAVATHLYKVIMAEKDRQLHVGALVMPNSAANVTAKEIMNTLPFVEKYSGLILLDLNTAKNSHNIFKTCPFEL